MFGFLVLLNVVGPLICRNAAIRNLVLLAFSFVFYWVWDGTLALLLAAVIIESYLCAVLTHKFQSRSAVTVSVLANLFVLVYFKYSDFFLNDLGGRGASFSTSLVIPIGLSFYIFQAISFNVDVYRGTVTSDQLSLLKFALYIAFFPQIAAGPIERYGAMSTQFERFRLVRSDDIWLGLEMIARGAFLKFVVADPLAARVGPVFDADVHLSSISHLLGLLYFGIQIFADFAGYSLMASGTARMLGIHLTRNFGSPYFATSLRHFWRHWHVSLSQFFRDYVYIPLGGSRSNGWRSMSNVLITFGLSGLWHGAGLTFLYWGLLHGIALIVEREGATRLSALSWFRTQMIVFFGWIFFRSDSLSDSFEFIKGFAQLPAPPEVGWSGVPFVILFLTYEGLFGVRQAGAKEDPSYRHKVLLVPILLCLVLGASVGTRSDFVYLRF